jgi:thiamine-phosphate diphosphorylase
VGVRPDSASSDVSETPSRLPRLHVVTDDAVLGASDFLDRAVRMLESGGPSVALHLRGPHTPGRVLHSLGLELVASARETGSLVVVNDRIDVAIACGAGGAHLGVRSLYPSDAREVLDLSPRAAGGVVPVLGASVHHEGELRAALDGGAQFLVVGSVFATLSHPGAATLGVDGLAAMVDRAGETPVLGIGGVTPARVAEALRVGAWGVAVLSGVWGEADPGRAVGVYLEALARRGADAAGPV